MGGVKELANQRSASQESSGTMKTAKREGPGGARVMELCSPRDDQGKPKERYRLQDWAAERAAWAHHAT